MDMFIAFIIKENEWVKYQTKGCNHVQKVACVEALCALIMMRSASARQNSSGPPRTIDETLLRLEIQIRNRHPHSCRKLAAYFFPKDHFFKVLQLL